MKAFRADLLLFMGDNITAGRKTPTGIAGSTPGDLTAIVVIVLKATVAPFVHTYRQRFVCTGKLA